MQMRSGESKVRLHFKQVTLPHCEGATLKPSMVAPKAEPVRGDRLTR